MALSVPLSRFTSRVGGGSAFNVRPLDHHMRPTIAILFVVALLIGCSSQQTSAPAGGTALAGSYYRGDHTGYNIYLDLLASGTYKAEWHGCLGVYGTARGTWTMVDGRIVLSPSKETDMMKGELRELHIIQQKGQTLFVPDLHDDYYQKYGPDEYAAFHRQAKK